MAYTPENTEQRARESLDAIFNRLIAAEQDELSNVSDPNELLIQEEAGRWRALLNNVFDVPSSSRAVAMRGMIVPKVLVLIDSNIEKIREDIFKNGEPWTTTPFHRTGEMMDRNLEECEGLYWRDLGIFKVMADSVKPQSSVTRSSARLWFKANESTQEVEMGFSFKREFCLEIGFSDPCSPEQVLVRYNSTQLPLRRMTWEEFWIMSHFLGSYCRQSRGT